MVHAVQLSSHIRQIQFNAAGYPTSITKAFGKPEAQTRTFSRDPVSNFVLSETDALGRKTTYRYDGLGNILQKTLLAGTASAATWSMAYQGEFSLKLSEIDPLGNTTRYSYDDQGNLIQVVDPLLHRRSMTYTNNGQIATVTVDPGGIGATTSFAYSDGVLASITDPLGRQTTLDTDVGGRVISTHDPLGNLTETYYDTMDRVTAVTDPMGNTVHYDFDANGNLTAFTDALSHVTTWTYDVRNRQVSKRDALSQVEAYQYDGAGNLIQRTDRKGLISGFTYDGLNRRITAGYGATAGSSSYTSTINYSYDAGNRLKGIVDSANGSPTFSYDGFDHLTQESSPQGTVSSTWDAVGHRLTQTVSGQSQVSYAWDAASRMTKITQGTASVSYSYDGANRRTQTKLANGVTIANTFDAASQLTGVTYTGPTGSTLGTLTYGYDAAGRQISKGGSMATVVLPSALGTATYDANNRLTNWAGTTITYDANGNILNDGTRSYTWNARNQLASLGTTSFQYDGTGRRIGVTASGQTVNFLHDGLQPVQELTGGTVKANLLNGPGIDEVLRRSVGATTSDFLHDALGSTLALTNSGGSMATTYAYEPYGNATSSGAVSDNRYQYTGRDNDGTGLYYYRARYYHPVFSRFVSEDPIGLAGGDNSYGYVDGDPINNADPKGLFKVHGNWCGPNWTGGRVQPYVEASDGHYASSTDYTDEACKRHDQCFAMCREANPCEKNARKACMTSCNTNLVNSQRFNSSSGTSFMTSLAIWLTIQLPPDPEENSPSCTCEK